MPISASRAQTCDDCSFRYFCSYHLKLPEKKSVAQTRGIVTHSILEILLKEKCRKYVNDAIKFKGINIRNQIYKLTKSLVSKSGILEDFEEILEMVFIGIKTDFFCEGCISLKPEIKFEISNENPKFLIKGFIDKLAEYPDFVKVVDFKTSKQKKSSKDLSKDLQGMIYSLAGYKLLKKTPKVEFIFLRFPKKPIQDIIYSIDDLIGFEYYLAEIQNKIQNFTQNDSTKNMANTGIKRMMLCGSEVKDKHICPFRLPFSYYAIVNEDGDIIKTAFEYNILKPKDGQIIIPKKFLGCPAYNSDDLS